MSSESEYHHWVVARDKAETKIYRDGVDVTSGSAALEIALIRAAEGVTALTKKVVAVEKTMSSKAEYHDWTGTAETIASRWGSILSSAGSSFSIESIENEPMPQMPYGAVLKDDASELRIMVIVDNTRRIIGLELTGDRGRPMELGPPSIEDYDREGWLPET